MEKLEKQIISEITRKRNLMKELRETDPRELLLHFSIGLYIRNKYLYGHPENVKKLSALYGTDDIDDISSCLVNKIYFKATGKNLEDVDDLF